jgi:ABC-type Fe3+/spermidine/putrescine transport system ATPase subunit
MVAPALPRGVAIRLAGLGKRYGTVEAVRDVTLTIEAGRFVTLLGPSGSGKTTVLMMIAGLVEPSAGTIQIGDRAVTGLSPAARDLGVVFQQYALFPHMTVAENIAFPLRMRRAPEAEIRRRLADVLDLVRLPGAAQRLPHQLSGGQQQRVALARALVFEPKALLLDEPMSALDKKLRESVQDEIKRLHALLGLTVVHVTHDQVEALALSDTVVIMKDGAVVQTGAPRALYERPASGFVADFLGASNFLRGRFAPGAGGATVTTAGGLALAVPEPGGRAGGLAGRPEDGADEVGTMVRPERVVLGAAAEGLANRFAGRIEDVTFVGDAVRARVRLSPSDVVVSAIPNRRDAPPIGAVGDQAIVGWQADDMHVFAS